MFNKFKYIWISNISWGGNHPYKKKSSEPKDSPGVEVEPNKYYISEPEDKPEG